ncbi:MAG: DUF721 domain-containing protein [Gaiellales bacterium]
MERLGEGLERALAAAGAPTVGPLAELTRAWPSAVGAGIARSAWPLRVTREGTLVVATASAAWANELTLLADEVLEKLRAVAPASTPSALRFVVGPVPALPAAEAVADATSRRPATAEELDLAGDVSSAIEDPELREMVQRAIAASLAARRADPPV